MSKVTKTQTIVLVTYSTPSIPACFAKSLSQHLFDNVMGPRNEAEEFVRVICDSHQAPKYVTEVTYQFGCDFYEELADEIAELLNEQIAVWMAKNNIEELVAA
jgi:hypothetical protein